MKYVSIVLVAFGLAGCSDASQQWFSTSLNTLGAGAAKVAALAPKYCKIRPETNLDNLALAGIALATSEKSADTIKSAVDKVCEWVGAPTQQSYL